MRESKHQCIFHDSFLCNINQDKLIQVLYVHSKRSIFHKPHQQSQSIRSTNVTFPNLLLALRNVGKFDCELNDLIVPRG